MLPNDAFKRMGAVSTTQFGPAEAYATDYEIEALKEIQALLKTL